MAASVQSPRSQRSPRSFDGFYLETACRLDAAYPGYLNALLHASPLKRAIQFAAFPEINFADPHGLACRFRKLMPAICDASSDPVGQIGRALMVMRARDIALSVFGLAPNGFVGMLGRLGHDPLPDPADYRIAYSLFEDPSHRGRAKLIMQSQGQIEAKKIKLVAKLPAILVHRGVLARLRDLGDLAALQAGLALIRELVPAATDEALRQSLDRLNCSNQDLGSWVIGWLRRMERLPRKPPIPAGDPELRLVQGAEFSDLGRRYRNCLSVKLAAVALGRAVVYEWRGPGHKAIVYLRSLSDGRFLVDEVRAARNRQPTPGVARDIQVRLRQAGVLTLAEATDAGRSRALARLLGVDEDLGFGHGAEMTMDEMLEWCEHAIAMI